MIKYSSTLINVKYQQVGTSPQFDACSPTINVTESVPLLNTLAHLMIVDVTSTGDADHSNRHDITSYRKPKTY